MIEDGKIDRSKTEYVDAYNQKSRSDVSGTICARIDASSLWFISEKGKE
jgi:hypothetical protein